MGTIRNGVDQQGLATFRWFRRLACCGRTKTSPLSPLSFTFDRYQEPFYLHRLEGRSYALTFGESPRSHSRAVPGLAKGFFMRRIVPVCVTNHVAAIALSVAALSGLFVALPEARRKSGTGATFCETTGDLAAVLFSPLKKSARVISPMRASRRLARQSQRRLQKDIHMSNRGQGRGIANQPWLLAFMASAVAWLTCLSQTSHAIQI